MNQEYNSIYMFKNPIRFFLNPENIKYPNGNLNIDNIDWTKPIDFKIRKYFEQNEIRDLKLPNFLNFYYLYDICKGNTNFNNIDKIDEKRSRIKVNLKTGEFVSYQYQINLEKDLTNLTEFDCLIKYDIKSFYNSIYTHRIIEYVNMTNDRYISNLNCGETNGLLMGNYISLYLAENLLKSIIENLKLELKKNNIRNKISYFSDDIYVFINKQDKDKLDGIFSNVLNDAKLEANTSKRIEYNYLDYTKNNILIKYWKTVISKQKNHNNRVDKHNQVKHKNNKYYIIFINQLIYRLTKIDDKKLRGVFIKNFFKCNFFINMDITKYRINEQNMHQLRYLISQYPEIILYIVNKFKYYKYFKKLTLNWFKEKLISEDYKNFYEEQIYFLYGINILSKNEIDKKIFNKLMNGDNQVLKSYLIMYHLPKNIDPSLYLKEGEENWFLNYHIILKIKNIVNQETLVNKYLIPENVIKKINNNKPIGNLKKSKYEDFYNENLNNNIAFIKSYNDVKQFINQYFNNKKIEREDLKDLLKINCIYDE